MRNELLCLAPRRPAGEALEARLLMAADAVCTIDLAAPAAADLSSLAPQGTKGAYASSAKSGVVDAALLTRYRVIFDYARERIVFEPRSSPRAPFEHDMSGAFLAAPGPGFDRPEVMNSLHPEANAELGAVFDEFAADPDAWVAIITGAGDRAFSAGNDLKATAKGDGQLVAMPAGLSCKQ